MMDPSAWPWWAWCVAAVALLHLNTLPLVYSLQAAWDILTARRGVDPWEGVRHSGRAWPGLCDYNLHMNNSSYPMVADRGRLLFFVGTHMYRTAKEQGWTVNNGGVGTIFIREIKPMAAFEVRTFLTGFDGKWFGLVSEFTCGGVVHARAVCKVVIKARDRRTVPPAELLALMPGVTNESIEAHRVDEVTFPKRARSKRE